MSVIIVPSINYGYMDCIYTQSLYTNVYCRCEHWSSKQCDWAKPESVTLPQQEARQMLHEKRLEPLQLLPPQYIRSPGKDLMAFSRYMYMSPRQKTLYYVPSGGAGSKNNQPLRSRVGCSTENFPKASLRSGPCNPQKV